MIWLNERLAITADKYQYIIGMPRERPRSRGEGTETVMLDPEYCRTLAQALRVAVSREMKHGVESGELQTLQAFARHLEKVTADFEAKIAALNV